MLEPHFLLVAVLRILLVKVVNDSLLDRNLIYSLLSGGLRRINLDVNLGPERAETRVESLSATHWMVRIEYVKRLKEKLVSPCDHLRENIGLFTAHLRAASLESLSVPKGGRALRVVEYLSIISLKVAVCRLCAPESLVTLNWHIARIVLFAHD